MRAGALGSTDPSLRDNRDREQSRASAYGPARACIAALPGTLWVKTEQVTPLLSLSLLVREVEVATVLTLQSSF